MAQEQYDVLNEHGDRTGEVLDKDVVHARGLWHASAHLWVIDSLGRVLVQYRAANKQLFPSCWDTSVAGHVSAGSTPLQTALREAHEEIGLDLYAAELKLAGVLREELPMVDGTLHREHATVFTTRQSIDVKRLKTQMQKSEVSDLKLIGPDELQSMLTDPIRRAELSGHEDKLFEIAIQAARHD